MSYIACAHCGNLNRSADAQCYSCGQELVPPPPPPPEPVQAPAAVEEEPWASNRDIRVKPLNPSEGADPSKARFKDLASRYEARTVRSIDATWYHGIRAGLPAGLLTGLAMGAYRKKNPDELTRLLVREKKIKPDGPEIAQYSMGFDLIFGLLLGIFLGATNLLCFTPEAMRTGAIVGLLVGGALLFLSGGSAYGGLVLWVIHGLVLAGLASGIERAIFRRG